MCVLSHPTNQCEKNQAKFKSESFVGEENSSTPVYHVELEKICVASILIKFFSFRQHKKYQHNLPNDPKKKNEHKTQIKLYSFHN